MNKATNILLMLIVGLTLTSNAQFLSISGDQVICANTNSTLTASMDSTLYETTDYDINLFPYTPELMVTADTLSPLADDTFNGPFAIGFDFCFYGASWTQFYIGSNGWISFSFIPNSNWYDPWIGIELPAIINSSGQNIPRNCIMPCWRDWHPGVDTISYIRYGMLGSAPTRKLVVEWYMPLYFCSTDFGKFQVVLHETTNIIDMHLDTVPVCIDWPTTTVSTAGSGVQGMQNFNATKYLAAPGRNGSAWSAFSESWRISPSGNVLSEVSWLDANGNVLSNQPVLSFTQNLSSTYYCELITCSGTIIDSVFVDLGNLQIGTVEIDPILCIGDSTWVFASVSAGTSPFSFLWQSANFQQSVVSSNGLDSAFNLPAGVYSLSITDSGACPGTDTTFTIDEPSSLELNSILFDIDTVNLVDGLIYLQVSGGTPPYLYQWSTGDTVEDISVASPGLYSVLIQDANACEIEGDFWMGIQGKMELDWSDFNIYPNPASDFLYVTARELRNVRFELYGMNGKKYLDVNQDQLNEAGRLDIRSLTSGTYFLKISKGKSVKTVKFVKH
jgi:hypothetical protein